MAYPTAPLDVVGLWLGWLLMMMIYSYPLYKETPVYRFAEHSYIAIMLAVNLVVNANNVMRMAVTPMLGGQVLYIVPIILGFMIYAMLHRDYRWVARYPIAILVGSGFGLGMRGVIRPDILDATVSTITPPVTGAMMGWINFVYIAVGMVCSIMYFLLTYEHSGALKTPTRIGRLFIMVALGAYFGNTVLFRLTMLTGRAKFFLQVLKIIPM
jgi:hypothetical protein